MIILTMKTTEEYLADGQVVETNTCIPYKWVVRENWHGEDLEVFDTKTEAEEFVKDYQMKRFKEMQNRAYKDIMGLTRERLLDLIRAYDEYVRQIVDENEGEPVTLAEFYENDYQQYFKEGRENLL